jgi:hypothetical protein
MSKSSKSKSKLSKSSKSKSKLSKSRFRKYRLTKNKSYKKTGDLQQLSNSKNKYLIF